MNWSDIWFKIGKIVAGIALGVMFVSSVVAPNDTISDVWLVVAAIAIVPPGVIALWRQ